MTYRPFPEAELARLADEYDATGRQVGPKMREFYSERAAMLRAALDQHLQLRERFLVQEMRVRELEAAIPKVA